MAVREGRSTKEPLQGQPDEDGRTPNSDADLRPEEERLDPRNPRVAGQTSSRGSRILRPALCLFYIAAGFTRKNRYTHEQTCSQGKVRSKVRVLFCVLVSEA